MDQLEQNVSLEKPNIGHVLQLQLRRSKVGLQIAFRIAPELENMFEMWGAGAQALAGSYAKYWTSRDSKEPISLWYPGGVDGVITSRGRQFLLDKPGHPLYVQVAAPLIEGQAAIANKQQITHLPNLTFLRCVGASVEEKIINIKGIYAEEYMLKAGEDLKKCVAALYTDYLKPTGVEVIVSTQRF